MKQALISLLLVALAGCAAAPVARVEPLQAAQYNEAGMRLAAQGRHEEAIEQFQGAIALEPGRAYLHNNLGYVHLLLGQPAKALQAFEAARHLDPRHPATLQNIKAARALLVRQQPPAPPVAARRDQTPSAPGFASTPGISIAPIAPHVFELRAPAVTPAAQPARPAEPARPASPRKPRLDVANGNGVPGMARRTAKQLARQGALIARVSNELPFNQQATVVQYRAGHEAEAIELAARVPNARTTLNDSLPARIDLRLVLGRDNATLTALAY
jgi:tetratricopeptide (TPR) repeat protein